MIWCSYLQTFFVKYKESFISNIFNTMPADDLGSNGSWMTTSAATMLISTLSGLILGLHPANEKWRCFVRMSHIGWAQA